MPLYAALVVYSLLIVVLLRLARDREVKVSPALWLPVAWLTISASRPVSMWLDLAPPMESPDDIVEGSPFDRYLTSGLMVSGGLIVLASRRERAFALLRASWPVLLFFVLAGVSFIWSDFPGVTAKRWVRATGSIIMILLVATERNPSAAIKHLFTRAACLLIPYSVFVIKYYPEMGRSYDQWSWQASFTGVATTKNGLGAICLIFGLACFWAFVSAYRERRSRNSGRQLVAYGVVLAMALWLLWHVDSATSRGCFAIGAGLILLGVRPRFAAGPAMVHLVVAVVIVTGVVALVIAPEMGLAGAVGRDDTLTGRTALWQQILGMEFNRWIGVGFNSFWLGARAEHFWDLYYWRPNQAHNGYIEMYISLGWAGLSLLLLLLGWAYRGTVHLLRLHNGLSALFLAYFVIFVLYNLTEAAVRGPLWFVFLLSIVASAALHPKEERTTARL